MPVSIHMFSIIMIRPVTTDTPWHHCRIFQLSNQSHLPSNPSHVLVQLYAPVIYRKNGFIWMAFIPVNLIVSLVRVAKEQSWVVTGMVRKRRSSSFPFGSNSVKDMLMMDLPIWRRDWTKCWQCNQLAVHAFWKYSAIIGKISKLSKCLNINF